MPTTDEYVLSRGINAHVLFNAIVPFLQGDDPM
jgi:hypothetical protein